MESTNNNNSNQLFLPELKELRNELSAMKKRIVQLEESQEKQQKRLNILERENHALITQLNINGIKESGSLLKRTDQDQVDKEEIESKATSVSVSASKKKTKTNNNNNDDDEPVVIPQCDNGDSFDSLSDDLLHKIVEFDGNCYKKFGSINKRCKNIYDMEEYKLKKETCVFVYGTVDMMLQNYLQKRREDELIEGVKYYIARAVVWYNRLDAIDWIIQLGDNALIKILCSTAVYFGRVNILSKVFCKLNLTSLDELLADAYLCNIAAYHGKLETLKRLRKYGAEWDVMTFYVARDGNHDDIIQYLRAEGCSEEDDETSGSEQLGSEDEDGDGDY